TWCSSLRPRPRGRAMVLRQVKRLPGLGDAMVARVRSQVCLGVALTLLAIASLPARAAAQEFRGAITGRVTDSSGGVLPGVTVTGETPLLELASGSAGQVIDEKRISLMPLSDGNPFVLARLVPGVAYTGDLKFSRPFDNGGTSSINADGSTGGNEFSLDGSPNMANGRRVAFVPPAGAVAEFKVQTATFDAADGHTAGAIVNVTLKSGTNRLKGEVYEYLRRDALEATDFFLLKAGLPKP